MNEPKMYLLLNDSGYTFLQGVERDSRPIVYGKEHPTIPGIILVTTTSLRRVSESPYLQNVKQDREWAFELGKDLVEWVNCEDKNQRNHEKKIARLEHRRKLDEIKNRILQSSPYGRPSTMIGSSTPFMKEYPPSSKISILIFILHYLHRSFHQYQFHQREHLG